MTSGLMTSGAGLFHRGQQLSQSGEQPFDTDGLRKSRIYRHIPVGINVCREDSNFDVRGLSPNPI